jgi:hypothetical protein
LREELEYQPGELYVKRYVRPKYARPESDGIVVGTLPTRPIEKGLAGPGLIAHVLGPAEREKRDSTGGVGAKELSVRGFA